MTKIFIALVACFMMFAGVAKPGNAQSPDEDKIFLAREVDVKAKIKNKLDALPTRNRDCPSPVEVSLKIVLRKSGRVTDITVLKSSGCSYDREAIKAASKLKFEPALKDGKPVSQYLDIQYKTERTDWPRH